MIDPLRIAFYAPIKPPDHPIPSGDRLIAGNLMKALALTGASTELISRYICYSKRSDISILEEKKAGALTEADRILVALQNRPPSERPQIWITYHPYCKAPDWIGAKVTQELGIPYVNIEAAKTGQGDESDPWKPWRHEAQVGIKKADLHLVFKPSDRSYLNTLTINKDTLIDFPTFVDLHALQGHEQHTLPGHWKEETPVLVTAGMMRKGKKDRNFYILSDVLSNMIETPWNLLVVGGGPEEEAIKAAFNTIPGDRLHWTGQVDHGDVLKWMRAADIFLWPGWREPIGMVYLEAQAQGLPVIAYESLGVPLVVKHQETGLLAKENDQDAMRSAIQKLLDEKEIRNAFGAQAKGYVVKHHSLESAANRLSKHLVDLLQK